MKITAEFCVESGGKCYVIGKTVHVLKSDLSLGNAMSTMVLENTYQRMSRELSRDIIKNTTMLAHLVTHPDDTP